MKHLVQALCALLLIAAASCSTTSKLAPGEILYTGVKAVDIAKSPDGKAVPADVADAINQAVAVKPNNPLLGSVKYRSPFPVGLWVYNHVSDSSTGFKGWLYRHFAKTPILVSTVRPEVRTQMIDEVLDNNGYFRGSASYSLAQKKNKKKASIIYDVTPGDPFRIDSVILLPDTTALHHLIDSVARRSRYLAPGARFCTDSLQAERTIIANALRNRGYYFFRPEFIEYLADSTITPGKIALKLTIARNTPAHALDPYTTGTITTYVMRNQGGGTPDTTMTSKGELIRYLPARLRPGLVPSCIAFRPGRLFNVRQMDRTQTRLSRMGIFSGIDINVLPDTVDGRRYLDVMIVCTYARPMEASVEVNVSSKSNSYLGPGVTFGLTNHNIFGGGETFSVNLTGAYEWQTGSSRDKSSIFNSYEIGLNATLAFPRLLAPKFIPRSRRDLNWTRLSLGADLLNRPHYFRMVQFNGGVSYDWRPSRYIATTFTPFKLTYTKLLNTTHDFDSIMAVNQAIAQSFRNTFIPQMSYQFTLDRQMDRDNGLNWQFTITEGGNLFWAAYEALGKKGEKKLFGTPFSQFIKGTTQLVYNRRVVGDSWLVSRLAVGAAHAYGNSSQVPYPEQFYCGGANSVRAFASHSLGPGSYRAPKGVIDGYFDQTGTFKFEANVEYRFPILGPLHGAVFLDAGNVWLLEEDPARPGGLLRGSTFFKDLATGTGVGLRFDISMLILRGDLGIGIHAPYDTGKRGYYNMESFGKSLCFHLAIGYPF